jgi:Fic family protein
MIIVYLRIKSYYMIHTVNLTPDWKLIRTLGDVDKFEGWGAIEKREGKALKELKSIATVSSVGASTRIEGSKMNDDEVRVLLENLQSSKLEERDAQEVAGYYETLNTISDSYRDISITENSIKSLHNTLLRHSQKDEWHRGNYKQLSNAVEATNNLAGTKQILFQPTNPGYETEEGMSRLIEWYNSDKETPPIVRSAIFIYDFLSIHPFQDGNGRLSRLLATLLLLRQGYSWIQYVSFEHEIESRKVEYYQVLMQCQSQRPGEDVYPWITFFISCLNNIQKKLMIKLESKNRLTQLSPKKSMVYSFIESHPGTRSGEIALKLDIPLPTVKRLLMEMVNQNLISKHGTGPGTHYYAEKMTSVKQDLVFNLTSLERKKEFVIVDSREFVEIKKIIFTPHFQWVSPDEWASKLINHGLYFKVSGTNNRGQAVVLPMTSVTSLISPTHSKPVLTLFSPINIPKSLWEHSAPNDYPIKVTVELLGSTEKIDFDVMVVYDAAIE